MRRTIERVLVAFASPGPYEAEMSSVVRQVLIHVGQNELDFDMHDFADAEARGRVEHRILDIAGDSSCARLHGMNEAWWRQQESLRDQEMQTWGHVMDNRTGSPRYPKILVGWVTVKKRPL